MEDIEVNSDLVVARESEGYDRLQRVLNETPIGNAFRTVLNSADDGYILRMFLMDNNAEHVSNSMFTEDGYNHISTNKYNIGGKILFVDVFYEHGNIKVRVPTPLTAKKKKPFWKWLFNINDE